jgi:YjbE family integral membrane protein
MAASLAETGKKTVAGRWATIGVRRGTAGLPPPPRRGAIAARALRRFPGPSRVELSSNFDVVGAILQICLIDLLLSGDNAILIAMACASLPPAVRAKAVLAGTGAAVLFRVVLTFVATLALRAPYLKLFGAGLLLLIAIELMSADSAAQQARAQRDPAGGLWRAIVLIVAADAVMSLDNVVAVAAAAQDNFLFLVLGLLISIPILVFASLFITRLLAAAPVLVEAGAALLGWIAGKTAVADPAIASVLETQSFGLVAAAPVLGALYVWIQGRRLRAQRLRHATAAMPAHAAAPPEASPVPVAPSAPAVSAGVAARAAQAAADAGLLPRRFSPMDLTIMAGVAVPLLGFVAMIVYLLVHAASSH